MILFSRWILITCLAAAGIGFGLGRVTRENPASTRLRSTSTDASTPSPMPGIPVSPSESALNILIEGTGLRQLARLSVLLQELTPAEMSKLADQLEILDTRPNPARHNIFLAPYSATNALPQLIAAWTRRDPAAATDWIRTRLDAGPKFGVFPGISQEENEVITAWAKHAPLAAVEYGLKYRHSSLGKSLIETGLKNLSFHEVAPILSALAQLPREDMHGFRYLDIWSDWAKRDLPAAIALVHTVPNQDFREYAISAILESSRLETPDLLQAMATSGVANSPKLNRLLEKCTGENPQLVAEWLLAHGEATNNPRARGFVQAWAADDAEAAFAWAKEHGVAVFDFPFAYSDDAVAQALALAENKKNEDYLPWALSLPPGEARNLLVDRKLNHWLGLDIEAGATAARATSGDTATTLAMRLGRAAAWSAAKTPPEALSALSDSLPADLRNAFAFGAGYSFAESTKLPDIDGLQRDYYLRGMALNRLTDLEKSFQRVSQISDPAVRRDTEEDMMWQVHRYDYHTGMQEAAKRWLTNSGLPAVRRQELEAILAE